MLCNPTSQLKSQKLVSINMYWSFGFNFTVKYYKRPAWKDKIEKLVKVDSMCCYTNDDLQNIKDRQVTKIQNSYKEGHKMANIKWDKSDFGMTL